MERSKLSMELQLLKPRRQPVSRIIINAFFIVLVISVYSESVRPSLTQNNGLTRGTYFIFTSSPCGFASHTRLSGSYGISVRAVSSTYFIDS